MPAPELSDAQAMGTSTSLLPGTEMPFPWPFPRDFTSLKYNFKSGLVLGDKHLINIPVYFLVIIKLMLCYCLGTVLSFSKGWIGELNESQSRFSLNF